MKIPRCSFDYCLRKITGRERDSVAGPPTVAKRSLRSHLWWATFAERSIGSREGFLEILFRRLADFFCLSSAPSNDASSHGSRLSAVCVRLPSTADFPAAMALDMTRGRLSQRKFRINMRSSPAEGLVPEYRMVFRSGDTVSPVPTRASNRFNV